MASRRRRVTIQPHIFLSPIWDWTARKKTPEDMFDQSQRRGEMSSFPGKLAEHIGDHVVLSLEGAVLVTSPGTE